MAPSKQLKFKLFLSALHHINNKEILRLIYRLLGFVTILEVDKLITRILSQQQDNFFKKKTRHFGEPLVCEDNLKI